MKKLHRFIGVFSFQDPQVSIHDRELIHQLRDVLRLNPGEECILCNGQGEEARVRLTNIEAQQIEVEILERYRNQQEPASAVTLYVSLLKRETFEWVVQKATEVGVAEIVPIVSHRTIKLGVKIERLQTIIREAAEQSGRGIVPRLTEVMTLEQALADAKRHGSSVFCHVSQTPLSTVSWKDGSRGIFIGPEGGWEDEEVVLAKTSGATIASLGALTLRAETAATIGSFLAVHD